MGCDIDIDTMAEVLALMPSIIKTIVKYRLFKPDVSIYRPKYRFIGDNIGLNCHRCQHLKLSTPSTSAIQNINTINIDVAKHHYHQRRQNLLDP
jgi:hypothetical protein